MAQDPARILFVHNAPTQFVRLDLEILKDRYAVTECYLESRRMDLPLLYRHVAKHDVIFGWFASWHTFFPMVFARMLRRPSLLVIGGYDLANLPAIAYGHQRGGARKYVSRSTMRLASRLMTNSEYSREEANRNAHIDGRRIAVIYHGVPDVFGELSWNSRECMALTVGNVDRRTMLRKGHGAFVRAAWLLPQMKFVLVGAWKDETIEHLRKRAPANVTFSGWVDNDTLKNYYQRASVYVQASLHEGFGMSVAEAMLGGCVPVVTRVGALSEVVGDTGVYIDSPKPEDICSGIRSALQSDRGQRARARSRVLQMFSMEQRAAKLWELIDQLVSKSGRGTGGMA